MLVPSRVQEPLCQGTIKGRSAGRTYGGPGF